MKTLSIPWASMWLATEPLPPGKETSCCTNAARQPAENGKAEHGGELFQAAHTAPPSALQGTALRACPSLLQLLRALGMDTRRNKRKIIKIIQPL